MAERSERGRKAAETDKMRYGEDFFSRIGQMGGKAAHERGTAHEFTSEEARRAGQKGGRARRR